jgi:glycosyltransferase involved in cell wall biosynthesis
MPLGIWFPAVRAFTGTDVFTEQLAARLEKMGFKVAIDWLPLRAEYAPWTVKPPKRPEWADIAHVNSWLSTRFIPAGLKVVTTIHHSIHDPRLRPYKGFARANYHHHWIRWLERRNLERADAIVAVSHYAASAARKALGSFDIRVIHNGIDLQNIEPAEKLFPSSPFRLIYVGTWMVRKGVDLFPEIMRQLGQGYELICIGGQPSETDRVAPPANIRFQGRITDRSELVRQLQAADAFLFPSRSEGFGLALVDGMACGLPAIAAKCSSAPEVVSDGISGILCPQDDVVAFVAAVRRLEADRGVWLRMREAARSRAVNMFDIERQIRQYTDLYASLVEGVGA